MKRNKRRYVTINRNRNLNKKRNKMNYLIIFSIIIMFLLGLIFIKIGLIFNNNKVLAYNYTAEKSDDYEVLLKPNDFYTTDTLQADRYYASLSVNSYLINFKYDFKGSGDYNIKYDYNITAELVGTVNTNDDKGKEVWNRTFNLFENNEDKEISVDNFSIEQGINIDYEYYNNLVRSFEEEYKITIDGVLKLRLNVFYNIDISELNLENKEVQDYIELDIPITNTVTNVEENYEKTTSDNIYLDLNSNIKEVIFYILGGIFILIAIGLIIIRIKVVNNRKTPKEIYEYNINHILRYYGNLIVTVINEPDLSNLKIMQLSSIVDLIDVAEQTQSNIIHYDASEENKSYLYVINNGYAYIYVVTDEKIK